MILFVACCLDQLSDSQVGVSYPPSQEIQTGDLRLPGSGDFCCCPRNQMVVIHIPIPSMGRL